MVRAVLVFGVEAVNAMFAGMMYGIPAYYAPGKKKDNHASAGTLRAYCKTWEFEISWRRGLGAGRPGGVWSLFRLHSAILGRLVPQ